MWPNAATCNHPLSDAPFDDTHRCPRRIVYNATAWQQLVAGLTQPLWVAVPVIQVLVAVLPWRVNGWFGIGFFAYYLLMTPLLFQVRFALGFLLCDLS